MQWAISQVTFFENIGVIFWQNMIFLEGQETNIFLPVDLLRESTTRPYFIDSTPWEKLLFSFPWFLLCFASLWIVSHAKKKYHYRRAYFSHAFTEEPLWFICYSIALQSFTWMYIIRTTLPKDLCPFRYGLQEPYLPQWGRVSFKALPWPRPTEQSLAVRKRAEGRPPMPPGNGKTYYELLSSKT